MNSQIIPNPGSDTHPFAVVVSFGGQEYRVDCRSREEAEAMLPTLRAAIVKGWRS